MSNPFSQSEVGTTKSPQAACGAQSVSAKGMNGAPR